MKALAVFATKKTLVMVVLISIALICKTNISAATFYFDPPSGLFNSACEDTVDIIIDPASQTSNAAEIEILYNTTQIDIIDADTGTSGTQIINGNAFERYIYNDVNTLTGRIKLAGISYSSVVATPGIFGSIKFTPKAGISTVNFTVLYNGSGATTDSNIANSTNSQDILISPINASYAITNDVCELDTEAPTVVFIQPPSGEEDVPPDGQIVFSITDEGSGVDLDSLVIIIDGQVIELDDPRLTYVITESTYIFTFTPDEDFDGDSDIEISISGSDLAGNEFTAESSFHTAVVTEEPEETPEDEEVPSEEFSPIESIEKIVQEVSTKFEELSEAEIPVIVAVTLTATTLLRLISLPTSIINILLLLLAKKKAKYKGIIYDILNNKPLMFAIIRVYDTNNNFLFEEISDINGKYSLALEPGTYYIRVKLKDYEDYETKVQYLKRDFYTKDIMLKPLNKSIELSRSIFAKIKANADLINNIVFYIGLCLATLAFIAIPNLLNFIILSIYILQTIAIRLIKGIKKGLVFDSSDKKGVKGIFVRVFDTSSEKNQIDVSITDEKGKFNIYLQNEGDYLISTDSNDYELSSNQNKYMEDLNGKYLQVKSKAERRLDLEIPLNKKNGGVGQNVELNPFA